MERSYELQKYKMRTDVPEHFHLQLDISRISGISNTQEQEGSYWEKETGLLTFGLRGHQPDRGS